MRYRLALGAPVLAERILSCDGAASPSTHRRQEPSVASLRRPVEDVSGASLLLDGYSARYHVYWTLRYLISVYRHRLRERFS